MNFWKLKPFQCQEGSIRNSWESDEKVWIFMADQLSRSIILTFSQFSAAKIKGEKKLELFDKNLCYTLFTDLNRSTVVSSTMKTALVLLVLAAIGQCDEHDHMVSLHLSSQKNRVISIDLLHFIFLQSILIFGIWNRSKDNLWYG